MIQEGIVNSPKSIKDTIEKSAKRLEGTYANRKVRYDKKKLEELAKWIEKGVESHKRNTGGLRTKLVRWNDLLEGIVEDTNFPFEGASNISMRVAAGISRTFRSAFNKTMFQDSGVFVGTSNPNSEVPLEEIDEVQDAMNWTFEFKSNGLDTLKDSIIPLFRDGTLIVYGYVKKEIEKAFDRKIYTTIDTFIQDFPSAEDMGVSVEAYDEILNKFTFSDKDDPFEYHAVFSYEFVKSNQPWYEIIPLAKFVFYPTHMASIAQLHIYGKMYDLTKQEIEENYKRGVYYAPTKELMKGDNPSESDSWSSSRNFAEGIGKETEADGSPVRLYDLIIKKDMDNDGIPEKYFVTWNHDKKIILNLEYYYIRRNIDCCVDFRVLRRDDRFLGVSLLGDAEDLFNEIDTIHRHRNNVRMLTTAPIVLANVKYKEELEFGRTESLIKPGVTFWVSDIEKAMKQFVLQNTDQPGNSLDEENLVIRNLETLVGPTQLMSGRETQTDPRAPFAKAALLLSQSNQRIDDDISEYSRSMSSTAKLHAALMYQSAEGTEVGYWTVGVDGKPAMKKVDREVFAMDDIEWTGKRRSVTMTPEFAMQREGALIAGYKSLYPLLAAKDPRAIEMWKRVVINSGEPDNRKLIYNEEPNPAMAGGFLQPNGGLDLSKLAGQNGGELMENPIENQFDRPPIRPIGANAGSLA